MWSFLAFISTFSGDNLHSRSHIVERVVKPDKNHNSPSPTAPPVENCIHGRLDPQIDEAGAGPRCQPPIGSESIVKLDQNLNLDLPSDDVMKANAAASQGW